MGALLCGLWAVGFAACEGDGPRDDPPPDGAVQDGPGGGDASGSQADPDAGAPDAQEPVETGTGVGRDDRAETGRNVAVVVDVLANDLLSDLPQGGLTVELVGPPQRGRAVVVGGSIRYEPRWWWSGEETFRYRVLQGLETVGGASVTVNVLNQTWLFMDGALFVSADLSDAPLGTVIFDRTPDGALVGWQDDGEHVRGLYFDADSWRTVEEPAGLRFHHGSAFGWAASHVGEGGAVGLVRKPDGGLESPFYDELQESALYGVNAQGVAVGAVRDPAQFGDAHSRAVLVGVGAGAHPVLTPLHLEAAVAGDAKAFGINGQGDVVGVFETVDGTRGFRWSSGGSFQVAPPGASWSVAYDINDAGTLVGSFGRGPLASRGFVNRGDIYHEIDPAVALETWIYGVGEDGSLVGGYRDGAGGHRPLWMVPRTIVPGQSHVPLVEPLNDQVQHACGHARSGPFEPLTAQAQADGAPAMSRSHTTYVVDLVPSGPGHGGMVLYNTAQVGPVTFYLDRPAPLGLTDAMGRPVTAAIMTRSVQCDRIAWIHQFQIPAAGTYRLQLGPVESSTVSIVYERGWPY